MAYNAYNRPGYGAQGGDDGGGFMTGTQQGSQSAGDKPKEDSLRAVTIKQLIDAREPYPGDNLTLDGQPLAQVTVVGQIRAINAQATNITYRIDDGTGVTDVKKWIDQDKAGDNNAKFALDTYVRCFGRITQIGEKRHINAHAIRAIEDFNEVNYHLLEAAYTSLFWTKGGVAGVAGAGGAGADADGGDGMFVDGGDGGNFGNNKLKACSKKAQTMYNYLVHTPGGNEGIHLNTVTTGTGLSANEVLQAADELLSQGLVYTTMDDETWAILDY
ncbi:hypothetical protein OQA88_12838 [Cercophora sp. LCS_1]